MSNLKISSTKLSENKVFILYANNKKIKATFCTIDGSSTTPKAITELSTLNADCIYVIALSEDRVFIVYYSNNILYGMICDIIGDEIIIKSNVQLIENVFSVVSVVKLLDNNILITYRDSINKVINAVVTNITDIQMTLYETSKLTNISSENSISATALSETEICISHIDSNSNLYALIYKLELIQEIQKLENEKSKILGITQKKGISGNMTPVTVPYFNIEEEN